MDVTAVADGLCTNAATITGLRTASGPLDRINVPLFEVFAFQRTFDVTMGRGADELEVTCRIYASMSSDRVGIATLSGYLAGSGAGSLKAALESERTLGGACYDLRVEGTSRWPVVYSYGAGEQTYYGAELTVRIWGSGD